MGDSGINNTSEAHLQHIGFFAQVAGWLVKYRARLAWLLIYVLLLALVYALLYFRFDRSLVRRISENEHRLATDDKLASLLNGSGIENIPNLNVITTSPSVEVANNCGKGPVPLGWMHGNDSDCVRLCANSLATMFEVDESSDFYFNQLHLDPGKYCRLGPRPECNLRTTTVIMTLNSIICRSRDPRVFGGPTGNNIIACNNRRFNDPLNVLWDTKKNRQVTAASVDKSFNIEELLDSGEYRYLCRFKGKDAMRNAYIQHPLERLHPMRNYCASEYIYAAHPDVKPLIRLDKHGNIANIECDCGDFDKTQVKNIMPSDKTSPCATRWHEIGSHDAYKQFVKIPFKCFNINSPITDVTKMLPCTNGFTERRSPIDQVEIEYTHSLQYPIESPAWDTLKSDTFRTENKKGAELC